MGIFSQRVVARVGLFLSVVVLGALGPVGTYSTASQQSSIHTYVLKVSDVSLASELVESVGGSVSHQMHALGYLGAELSVEQVQLISRSALVSRISEGGLDDRLAGMWWHFAEPETPEVEEAVAGMWWHFAEPETPEVEEAVAGMWWHFAEPETPEVEEAVAGMWWHFAKPETPVTDEEFEDSEFGGIAELQNEGELTVAGMWWHF